MPPPVPWSQPSLFLVQSSEGLGTGLYTKDSIRMGELIAFFGGGTLLPLEDDGDVKSLLRFFKNEGKGVRDLQDLDCVIRFGTSGKVLVVSPADRQELIEKERKKYWACFAQHSHQLPNAKIVCEDGKVALRAIECIPPETDPYNN